jgi:hypothetical protein
MMNEYHSEAMFSQPLNIIQLFRLNNEGAPGSIASLVIDWLEESHLLARVKGVAYLREKIFSYAKRLKFGLA